MDIMTNGTRKILLKLAVAEDGLAGLHRDARDVSKLENKGLVNREGYRVRITPAGKKYLREAAAAGIPENTTEPGTSARRMWDKAIAVI